MGRINALWPYAGPRDNYYRDRWTTFLVCNRGNTYYSLLCTYLFYNRCNDVFKNKQKIFHNVHNNIKCVVWYGDSRFQRFLMISSHLHRKFQLWSFFYLVTKTSNQLLNLDPGGSRGKTYIKWKAWISSFRKYWLDRESWWEWWWNDAFKKWARTKFSQMAPHVLKIYILIWFSSFY